MQSKSRFYKYKTPTSQQVEKELKREKEKKRRGRILLNSLYVLIVVAAISTLIATMALPVIEIAGNSMEPNLKEKDIVLLVKSRKVESGELVCFSYQNKLLIKRIVAKEGDVVNITDEGNVIVNGKFLEESYISQKDYGNPEIKFPHKVAKKSYFVLGDHREVSVDSRSYAIGDVNEDQIVGKIILRIWPFKRIGIAE